MTTVTARGSRIGLWLGALALVAVAALLLVAGLVDELRDGWSLAIDDHEWPLLPAGGFDANLGAVVALTATLLLALVAVPLVLMLVGLLLVSGVALVLVCAAAGVAAALAAGLLAVALATSPLWLLLLLLWLLLRPRRRPVGGGYDAA